MSDSSAEKIFVAQKFSSYTEAVNQLWLILTYKWINYPPKGLFLRFLNVYILSHVVILNGEVIDGEPGDDYYDILKSWPILSLVILIKKILMKKKQYIFQNLVLEKSRLLLLVKTPNSVRPMCDGRVWCTPSTAGRWGRLTFWVHFFLQPEAGPSPKSCLIFSWILGSKLLKIAHICHENNRKFTNKHIL